MLLQSGEGSERLVCLTLLYWEEKLRRGTSASGGGGKAGARLFRTEDSDLAPEEEATELYWEQASPEGSHHSAAPASYSFRF